MSSKRKRKNTPFRQPYIVVWRTCQKKEINASHEGVCAPSLAEAYRQALALLDECEHVVSAYNEGQCARMRDSLVRLKRTGPPDRVPFVVFYDRILPTYGGYSCLDRLEERWIAVLARDCDEAIEIAGQQLESTFEPFLAYDLDDMEEIASAIAASWPGMFD